MNRDLGSDELHPHEGSEVVLSDGRVGEVVSEPSQSGDDRIAVRLPDVGTVHVAMSQLAEVRGRQVVSVFRHDLGAALTMELLGLSILRLGMSSADDEDVVALFADHRYDCRTQVDGIGQMFRIAGWDVDSCACPAVEALWAQSRRECRQAAGRELDNVLLAQAMTLERYEIGAYEALIRDAPESGRETCAEILGSALDSERQALAHATALRARCVA